ncbi:MAG: CTP synthase [Ignavibacteria bacterium]|nr:CTP synthase [Ignavibacteria bacterium]
MNSKIRKTRFKTKYIFIFGGVVSSLGKGIAAASLGLLLKQRNHKVTIMKLDPYINVDPGTMNPYQHGEVYVTDDGAETDLDLGHYERFLAYSLGKENNTTAGQVYYTVITKEREGQFLGKTVQVIPHITDEIKRRISVFDGSYEFVIVEIGGTVGDIESLPFLEATRQFAIERGPKNAINIILTYVPYIKSAGELKTKPTQHSVKSLMEHGIVPDIIICRSETKLSKEVKSKIALFCNVDEESVIDLYDVETIYEVPLILSKSNLDQIVLKKLNIPINTLNLDEWKAFVKRIKQPLYKVKIGLVGKYVKYRDSYKSILEAFIHAGSINNTAIELELIDSEELNDSNCEKFLSNLDGILVGPGFGKRGIEGKISAIKYVRENKIPFFGICLGMQCAIIEFSRNVCGLENADSTEFNKKTKYNVIDLMEEQKKISNKGGTMRLGQYPCVVKKGTLSYEAYGQELIFERHRHRYEVNTKFQDIFEKNGMIMSGLSPDGKLIEMIELKDHPWFIGVQFHPELKSRAVTGAPLFIGFIKAALNYRKNKSQNME